MVDTVVITCNRDILIYGDDLLGFQRVQTGGDIVRRSSRYIRRSVGKIYGHSIFVSGRREKWIHRKQLKQGQLQRRENHFSDRAAGTAAAFAAVRSGGSTGSRSIIIFKRTTAGRTTASGSTIITGHKKPFVYKNMKIKDSDLRSYL